MEARIYVADVCLSGKRLHDNDEEEVDTLMRQMCRCKTDDAVMNKRCT